MFFCFFFLSLSIGQAMRLNNLAAQILKELYKKNANFLVLTLSQRHAWRKDMLRQDILHCEIFSLEQFN